MGKPNSKHFFETSGNYVFSISRREIEKTALGLNFPTVAFKGSNDAYFVGGEYEKMSAKGPLQKKTKRAIARADFLCKLGFLNYGLLTAIIFKEKPSPELEHMLESDGYEVVHLPKNPYIGKSTSSL